MKKTITAVLAIAVLGLAGTSMAANRTWTGTTGNWTNTANWNTYPLATDNARFNAGSDVTVDSAVQISLMAMGYNAGSYTSVLEVASGGALTVNRARVGNTAGTTGIVNINGGDLIISGGNHAFGYAGSGVVNLNSGTFHSSSDIALGRDTGSDGKLYVTGGTLSTVENLTIGGRTVSGVPTGATGLLDISGGASTHTIGGILRLGNGGAGTMLLSAGTVDVTGARLRVGDASAGMLAVSGSGDLTVNVLNVGGNGFDGIANLNGGAVHAGKVFVGDGGILTLRSAAILDTYTNMSFSANGLLVWEGDHSADVATLAGDGTFTWGDATAVYEDTKAFDAEYQDAVNGQYLRTAFDGTNTEVWTVIPEPATLGLVGLMGAGMLFVRRLFKG